MAGSNPFPLPQDALENVEIRADIPDNAKHLLTADALAFVATLHRTFNERRLQLLEARQGVRASRNKGVLPDFLRETQYIREDKTWTGPALGPGLIDRRVEITGPPDRKMVINALNSKVATYMTDFEDSMTPTWHNVIDGQVNLYDAVRRDLTLVAGKKTYRLNTDSGRHIPTLIVRPRGWHLSEKHIIVDGVPISGSLFDFAIYFYHNAKESKKQGFGPYFYLPKMEHHLEAKLWADVFSFAEAYIALQRGTIRATVLIETIEAVFQMDEIIYQLRDYSAGLNCGRWDYIFSYIKVLGSSSEFLLPDRSQVTMKAPFMSSYVKLLIKTCHARKVSAIGGMAATIPIKTDPEANQKAMDAVQADKLREVLAGHDGTWIAHPALADTTLEIFNKHMKGANQISSTKDDGIAVTNYHLLNPHIPGGVITEAGIKLNLRIGLLYIANWLEGVGCSPINYLMEDAATAEVSRMQLHQWVKHGAHLNSGKQISVDLVKGFLDSEFESLTKGLDSRKRASFDKAKELFSADVFGNTFEEFITLRAYDEIVKNDSKRAVSASKI
ncbi:unnamed protein product [Kuraishia capsulata CBS 1993]|uniref:malate synthase n=1 Tax=Kuraishia capsulata CBS 1993 TaxID=1382522 RepID=W6MMV3_9ASCO|nr:uncharacterized protein KUCA_T00003501001 [Kuraishia capsulata CBS 1993]CDK27523.1 unnamed protein product [Kuraishia capsulata CBS 1993]